jgi:hypothetical protein
VGDLLTGLTSLRIGTSGRYVDWTDMAEDRDQWEICGLNLFRSGYEPVGDLLTGFTWLRIGTSGKFVDWTDMAEDRDQWKICGLNLFGSE